MALPTQLNATEQDTLVKQIGLALLRAAPRDWRSVTAEYRAVGRYHELTGETVTSDGDVQEWVATHDIATLFGRLRAGMYREGRGTWFNARYQLDHPSSYNLEYDREEPHWDLAPPPQAYADELRMFPRSEDNVPDWLMRRMSGLGPERPGPRFRIARIFDGADPGGRPVINRPELDVEEQDRLLDYLDGAPVVIPGRGYDVDRLANPPESTVPIAFHSDGTWIWPAAVNYYLREYGVSPEQDLVQHVRGAGFHIPDVPDEVRQAAAGHVDRGGTPQQRPAPPRAPEPEVAANRQEAPGGFDDQFSGTNGADRTRIATPMPGAAAPAFDDGDRTRVAQPVDFDDRGFADETDHAGHADHEPYDEYDRYDGPDGRDPRDAPGSYAGYDDEDGYDEDGFTEPRSASYEDHYEDDYEQDYDDGYDDGRGGVAAEPTTFTPVAGPGAPTGPGVQDRPGDARDAGARGEYVAEPTAFTPASRLGDTAGTTITAAVPSVPANAEQRAPEPPQRSAERHRAAQDELGDDGPPTEVDGAPVGYDEPVLADLHDRLDDLGIPEDSYRLGEPTDRGWSLEEVQEGWRVGWYDGELRSPAVFGDAHDAAAFMLGKLLLAPEGSSEVPSEPAPPAHAPSAPGTSQEQPHSSPQLQSSPQPHSSPQPQSQPRTRSAEGEQPPASPAPSRPVTATLSPEVATGAHPLPSAQAPEPQRGDRPEQRPAPRHEEPAGGRRVPEDEQQTPDGHRSLDERAAPGAVAGVAATAGGAAAVAGTAGGGSAGGAAPAGAQQGGGRPAGDKPEGRQQQSGNQWPIQPMQGEPPLTLFRGKEMRDLPAGSELDRFGGPNGNLTYAAGTPFEERSLVPEWVNRPYHVYRVQRPLEALAGVAIPWFNQPGGGAAYLLPASIDELVADGDLIELDPGEPPID